MPLQPVQRFLFVGMSVLCALIVDRGRSGTHFVRVTVGSGKARAAAWFSRPTKAFQMTR